MKLEIAIPELVIKKYDDLSNEALIIDADGLNITVEDIAGECQLRNIGIESGSFAASVTRKGIIVESLSMPQGLTFNATVEKAVDLEEYLAFSMAKAFAEQCKSQQKSKENKDSSKKRVSKPKRKKSAYNLGSKF